MGEIPHLKALVERHKEDPFAIVGVNTDDDKDELDGAPGSSKDAPKKGRQRKRGKNALIESPKPQGKQTSPNPSTKQKKNKKA